jgi:F0F1-type ATP synthase membrane subunit b/b'
MAERVIEDAIDCVNYTISAGDELQKLVDRPGRINKADLPDIAETVITYGEDTKTYLKDIQEILQEVGHRSPHKSIIAEAEESAERIRQSAKSYVEWWKEEERKRLKESFDRELNFLTIRLEDEMDARVEAEVQRRINQLYGREATLQRKRSLDLDKAYVISYVGRNNVEGENDVSSSA